MESFLPGLPEGVKWERITALDTLKNKLQMKLGLCRKFYRRLKKVENHQAAMAECRRLEGLGYTCLITPTNYDLYKFDSPEDECYVWGRKKDRK